MRDSRLVCHRRRAVDVIDAVPGVEGWFGMSKYQGDSVLTTVRLVYGDLKGSWPMTS